MYWTLELASYLEDAPWPATKDELIEFSIRTGVPAEVIENLQELGKHNKEAVVRNIRSHLKGGRRKKLMRFIMKDS